MCCDVLQKQNQNFPTNISKVSDKVHQDVSRRTKLIIFSKFWYVFVKFVLIVSAWIAIVQRCDCRFCLCPIACCIGDLWAIQCKLSERVAFGRIAIECIAIGRIPIGCIAIERIAIGCTAIRYVTIKHIAIKHIAIRHIAIRYIARYQVHNYQVHSYQAK